MKAGRKNLQRAVNERDVVLSEGQSIVQAVAVRGSNIVEVMDARGNKLLALLPAKFQKTLWVGRGSFVVVDDSGKEKALQSGSKVGSIVSRVLFHEQVRELQKSPDWPEVFRSSMAGSQKMMSASQHEERKVVSNSDSDWSDDESLPPLEPNTNRLRPLQSHPDESHSASSSDLDS